MKKILMSSVLATSSLFAFHNVATAAVTVEATPPVVKQSQTMQNHHKGDGNYRRGQHNKFAQLNLTAAQQAKIDSIMQAKKQARQAKWATQKAERAQWQQQIQALTNSATLNNNAVNSLADQQAAKAKQRFIDRVQTQHAISQVLNVEQRQQLMQLKAQGKGKGYQGQQ